MRRSAEAVEGCAQQEIRNPSLSIDRPFDRTIPRSCRLSQTEPHEIDISALTCRPVVRGEGCGVGPVLKEDFSDVGKAIQGQRAVDEAPVRSSAANFVHHQPDGRELACTVTARDQMPVRRNHSPRSANRTNQHRHRVGVALSRLGDRDSVGSVRPQGGSLIDPRPSARRRRDQGTRTASATTSSSTSDRCYFVAHSFVPRARIRYRLAAVAVYTQGVEESAA